MTLVIKWVLIYFVKINIIAGQHLNGEQCVYLKTGHNGTCKNLKDCPEEIDQLKKGIYPQTCGFEGLRDTIVCCTQRKINPTVTHLEDLEKTKKPDDIANKKCKEYSESVYTTVLNPTLLAGAANVTINQCAIKPEELIVDGAYAAKNEFPHIVVIGYGKTEYSEMDWLCGGSLLSEKHVLTAAHCTLSKSGPPQKVRLGTKNMGKPAVYDQEVVIEKFINHPEYDRRTGYHDISILFLKNNVNFSASVRPACLKLLEKNTKLRFIATGFEKSTIGNEARSLIKGERNIIPDFFCSNLKRKRMQNITDNRICAGHRREGPCQGNSGGILQVTLPEPYCMYGLVGIASSAEFCETMYSPIIYTRVDPYISWIESVIWP